jgi:hypothetical protein
VTIVAALMTFCGWQHSMIIVAIKITAVSAIIITKVNKSYNVSCMALTQVVYKEFLIANTKQRQYCGSTRSLCCKQIPSHVVTSILKIHTYQDCQNGALFISWACNKMNHTLISHILVNKNTNKE